ncbi:hypothetical protein [Marinobacterium mangrovicola]|uniref:Immunity protein 22 of polymorphic toxin system n=1 Tax=Marinobacterium mangrovicola TaxID=1476959 RepID=A0A4R1GJT4_9GAMM|nr:hypothetical protein [Marinobacterium mangrovicola]TCK08657.1 hypothetical protein CLV83_0749 [Marinobacterium mangrovicola]
MQEKFVYVFSGEFEDIDAACLYSQPQWEPEPDESVSDEEYAAWEDRNPSHQLRKNIDSYLDEDFIETVDLDFQYLSSIGVAASDIAHIKENIVGANVLVLVYEQALGGFSLKEKPVSNSSLTYCGQFNFKL